MATAFTEAGAYMLGTSTYSGYYRDYYSAMYSTNDDSIAKNGQYIAPETQQCGAKGVYLLTDGFPNNVNHQETLKDMMGSALGDTSSVSCPSFDGLLTGKESGNQWQCMGEFAKQLRTKRNVTTAMVGFGADFSTVDDEDYYQVKNITLNKFTDSNGAPYNYEKSFMTARKYQPEVIPMPAMHAT